MPLLSDIFNGQTQQPDFSNPTIADYGPNTFSTSDIVDEYQKFRDQQNAALQQHQQYAQSIQSAQDQANQKATDLNIADRLYKIFDPNVARSARQYLLQETAQYVGVDPKSPRFKALSQMVMGLDPDTMQSMKTMFADQLQSANPGQVKQMIQGIMNGTIPVNDVVGQIAKIQRSGPPMPERAPTHGTETPPTQTENIGEVGPSGIQRPPEAATPFQSGGSAPTLSFQGNRVVPPQYQQASPQLIGALGLDSTVQYRNQDLISHGFRIPFDAQSQEKLAQTINTQSTGITSTISEAGILNSLITGHPEVLGTVGNAASYIQSAVRQVQGALQLINPELKDESTPFSPELQKLSKDVGDQLMRANSIQATAENASRVQAIVLGLAYKMALAEGIPGNRLTNVIIQQHLRQIGHSASPEQFKAVLKDTISSTLRTFDEDMRRTVGTSGYNIVARQLSDADINQMAQNAEMLPKPLAMSIRDEAVRRSEGRNNQSFAPMHPTIQEEQSTLGRLETQGKQQDIAAKTQSIELAQSRENRAGREEKRQEAAQGRIERFQQENLDLAKQKFNWEKQKYQEQKSAAEQAKIGKALQAFGNAIAHSVHGVSIGGGGGGGGGEQNAGAFRLNPTPQRARPGIPSIQIPPLIPKYQ
jgi:hypothetical protein